MYIIHVLLLLFLLNLITQKVIQCDCFCFWLLHSTRINDLLKKVPAFFNHASSSLCAVHRLFLHLSKYSFATQSSSIKASCTIDVSILAINSGSPSQLLILIRSSRMGAGCWVLQSASFIFI